MIFAHVSLIQEGEAALFYRFDRKLNGYMIAGLFIAPNMTAKLSFAKVWKYFVSTVVRAEDIYCSVPIGIENSMFNNYLHYYDTIEGLRIYKVDNFLRDKYSSYTKHKQIIAERAKKI